MKTFKQFIEAVRLAGEPVKPLDMIKDIKTIDDEPNPLRKQLRHIRYKKYIDAYGIGS